MFGRKTDDAPRTRIQRKEDREEESLRLKRQDVYITGISAMASLASTAAIILTSLNRKSRKQQEDEEPIYYMSESMGLIRWDDKRR